MASISDKMRQSWDSYACKREKMVRISFGPDSILVAPETIDAWKALESVLLSFGYNIRTGDTDSYNCREIKSGGKKSLHSYGIALDINWKTNPYLDHAGSRKPKYSSKATQDARADEVRLGKADTDMKEEMVQAALAISTTKGKRIFGWGGNWNTLKDSMHFQVEVTPEELEVGVDWSTVDGIDENMPEIPVPQPRPSGSPVDSSPEPAHRVEEGLPKIFFDSVRSGLFGGALSQTSVDNMTAIIRYWLENYPDNPINQLAYILATVRHEVGYNMKPVREGFAKNDAEARRILRNRSYARSRTPYGHAYYGRGYVQLTHKSNYERQSEKIGIDLVKYPDRALEPLIALRILLFGMMDGDFNGRGHGLAHYVNTTRQDFVGARYTVNIQEKASRIAGYAEGFLSALTKAQAEKGAGMGLLVAEVQPEDIREDQTVIDRIYSDKVRYEESGIDADHERPHRVEGSLGTDNRLGDILSGLQPSEYRILLNSLGLDSQSVSKLEHVLGALEKAGVIRRASGLTPVNAALGDTVGKALNGRKTVFGVIALIASVFLPQFAPVISAVSGVADATATTGAASTQSILTPLAALLTGWGALGKIDKWMHKPSVNSIAEILSKIGK
ncbi:MAG: M15 family metallopeptidase [Pseudomonadota bacterium]